MATALMLGLNLAAGQSGGPSFDWFVDSVVGNDNNAGTLAAPFATIGKAMSVSTSLNKRVGLKRGSTFRETATISQDSMVLGAYGSGALPRINGANLIQSAWTNTPANSGVVTQANMRASIVAGAAFVDFSSAGALIPYLNQLLTITDSGGKKLTGYIKAAGTAETYGAELLANTDFATTAGVAVWYSTTLASVGGGQSGNCLQVTQTSGGFGFAYQSLATTTGRLYRTSGYMQKGTETSVLTLGIFTSGPGVQVVGTNALPATFTQYLQYFTAAAASYAQVYGGSTDATNGLFDTVSAKQVLTPSATGVTITSTSGGSTFNWASEDVGFNRNDAAGYSFAISGAGGSTNVWQTPLATQPKIVAFNGVGSITVANLAAVDTAGEWYWASNTLYVYSTSDPATAFTSVEAGARSSGVALNGKNSVAISNIDARLCNSAGITSSASANTGINITGCNLYYNGGAGIAAFSGSTGWVIANNTITYNGGGQGAGVASADGIYAIGDATGGSFTISGNTCNNNYGNGLLVGGTNNIVAANSISTNGNSGFGYGIETLGGGNDIYNNLVTASNAAWGAITLVAGNSNKVHHNRIFANADSGIAVDAGTSHEIGYNVIYGNSLGNGYGINLATGGVNSLIYNNTCVGNQVGLRINTGITGVTVRNNILASNVIGYLSPVAATIANNDVWGNSSANYSGTANQTGSNGNISVDPTFTNSAANDYSPQAGSPCIDAGFDLGASYKSAVAAGAVWPTSVSRVDQGALWDIGAYAA